jgi:anti-sigma regulatory factor (Ser/Thr protein kinase)
MTADGNRNAALRLAPVADAPRRARDFLTATCLDWGATQFLESGGLAVSELVTNAVRYAGTEIRLGLELAGLVLTVTVHDSGTGEPRIVPPDQRLAGGRGLAMVAKLAESWGVDARDGGKSVWCRLRAPAPPPQPLSPS